MNNTSDVSITNYSSIFTLIKAVFIALPFTLFLFYVHISGKKIEELQAGKNDAYSAIRSESSLDGTYHETTIQDTVKPRKKPDKQNAYLSNQIKTLNNENHSLKNQLQEIESKGNTNDVLVNQNKNLRDEVSQLQAQNNELQGQNKNLSDQNNEYGNNRNSTNEQIQNLQRQADELRNEIATEKNNEQQIQSQLNRYIAANNNLQNQNNTLQTQLTACENKGRIMKAPIRDKNVNIP